MGLSVLLVAYPHAPVSDDAVGGAEQIVARLDEALVRAGHRSIVVASRGSRVRGELIAPPVPAGPIEAVRAQVQRIWRDAIDDAVGRHGIDVVHLHGVDFDAYLPTADVPVLATLHLPLSWYRTGALAPARRRTYLQCVSRSQRDACPPDVRVVATIDNGVDLTALRPGRRRRAFVLALGRICPEKGQHLAIDAAVRARAPIAIAGEVFGYAEHERYFREEVAPRLGPGRRFLRPIGLARKRALLAAARCLLVPSLAPETSSLAAMEALACDTPVVALAAGALPSIVDDGLTGFVVDDVEAMSRAIGQVDRIARGACRAAAEARFSAATMTARYVELHRAIATGEIDA